MRRTAPLLALLLVTTGLVGCLGADDTLDESGAIAASGLRLTEVPTGATVEAIENGLKLTWADVELPFDQEIEVPAGATLVRASIELNGDQAPFVQLVNAETGRRRCQVPYVHAWNLPTLKTMTCAGLTAIDELPATWRIEARGPQGALAEVVGLELLNVPLDGLVADLELSRIDKPTLELQPTESTIVESFDGAELYVEVTLPEGDGPFPTVIASSPYNGPSHVAGEPSQWEYFVQDWAKRGYAVVAADVRGTGYSGGCMEVWGPNEARDQAVLVEWAASQPWSTGKVGFYGQSYVGTTPVEAAVQAPEALKAIIAVAPVINAYDDWHFGGVPNGEQLASPLVGYQLGTGGLSKLDMNDPLSALGAANGVCDPTLTLRANDPRAIYDAFYEERNFSKGAANVEAAVLYTQGFEDSNVKSAMITHWFNALEAPKLGLFGHWVHQHPVRADHEALFLAWMETFVKGKELGVDALPNVAVLTNVGTHRTAEAWPPTDARRSSLYPDLSDRGLGSEPAEGSATILLDATGVAGAQGLVELPTMLRLSTEVAQRTHLAGNAALHLDVTLQGAQNAHVAAFLWDEGPDETRLVTWGMANLAHRNGHDSYEPVAPGEEVRMGLPFLPTEHVFEAGHTLVLELRGAVTGDWFLVTPAEPSTLTVHGGPDGTVLGMPVLVDGMDEALPVSAGT